MAAYLLRNWQLGLVGVLTIGSVVTSGADRTLAQIKPDATLGTEGSVVTPGVDVGGQLADRIDGGATRGINLFHSFDQFNVEDGQRVYLTNPIGIENILTRVTGINSSNILGTLGVTGGNANLFLINPNGIIFGSNARLDVGGSFTATTANAVGLGETGLFSAFEPATSNLLTVRPSALFFNAVAAGAIVNQSKAQSLSGQTNSLGGQVGLQVPTGQTLALIGGDVAIEGGNLTAAGGRIELGSVAGVGEVSLSEIGNRLPFGYDKIDTFGNIQLEGGAVVDVGGEGGGDVQLQGAQLEMTQGSVIYANTLGSGNGGEILVRTTETVAVSDGSVIAAAVFGSGTGGDLTIATRLLLVRDGGQLGAGTFSTGEGGTLSVTASDTVELIGTTADGQTASGLYAATQGQGDAGELTIATRRLLVRDGAVVSAGTFGTGKGATLSITASDTVEVIGRRANGQYASGLFTQTQGEGDAGELTITTGRLLVRDGAVVSAGTRSTGKGGTLSVMANHTIEVIGKSADGRFPSTLTAQTTGAGNARNLTIATQQLTIRNGAEVNVSSTGTGIAGELRVEADAIRLDNQGKIRADTRGGGGNINLSTDDLILRRGSSISTNARGSNITGGNITIDTDNLVAVPQEDSDISANAENSFGGRVIVNASGIFGTEFRPQDMPLSDITASSALGAQFNGVVQLNTPDIDPSRGLANLPIEVVDASNQIDQTCAAGRGEAGKNEFIIIGRGGLPSNPYEMLSPDDVWEDVRPPSGFSHRRNSQPDAARIVTPQLTTGNPKQQLVEAQGWGINDKGQVVLTATASTATPHDTGIGSATCPSI
jgi:filamentous hemagglutinin family protein